MKYYILLATTLLTGSIIGLSQITTTKLESSIPPQSNKATEQSVVDQSNKATKQSILASLITKASTKHNVDRSTLSCILYIESTYDQSKVSNTMDYGIAQINIQNIRRFNLDFAKVLNSTEYNIDFGARLLSHYETLYKPIEQRTWACRYNVGTRSLRIVGGACEAYLERLNACLINGAYL